MRAAICGGGAGETPAALQACLEATGGPQTSAHTHTGAALLYHESCFSGITRLQEDTNSETCGKSGTGAVWTDTA